MVFCGSTGEKRCWKKALSHKFQGKRFCVRFSPRQSPKLAQIKTNKDLEKDFPTASGKKIALSYLVRRVVEDEILGTFSISRHACTHFFRVLVLFFSAKSPCSPIRALSHAQLFSRWEIELFLSRGSSRSDNFRWMLFRCRLPSSYPLFPMGNVWHKSLVSCKMYSMIFYSSLMKRWGNDV